MDDDSVISRESTDDFEYHDYTLTFLDFADALELKQQPNLDTILEQLYDEEWCGGILWGRDRKTTHRVVILIAWSEDTTLHERDMLPSVWAAQLPTLRSTPRSLRITLNIGFPSLFPGFSNRYEIHEIITIQGRSELVNPTLFERLDLLVGEVSSSTDHEFPSGLVGIARGISESGATDRERTIATLWTWLDDGKRLSFQHPGQNLTCRGSPYEETITGPLRDLEAQGAVIEKTVLYLRRWFPNRVVQEQPPQRCIII